MKIIDVDTFCRNLKKKTWFSREEIIEELNNAPIMDAKPIQYGHWINTGSGQECSVCHEIQYGIDTGRFYCANCGAKNGGNNNDTNR